MRTFTRLLVVGLYSAFLIGCTEEATKPQPAKDAPAPKVNADKGIKEKPMVDPPRPPGAPDPKETK
jgi:hypothetical protein